MHGDLLVVSFNDNYQTPAMFSISAPEAICEVAENLRDHVMDQIWTVWPVCPAHGRGLSAEPVQGGAAWVVLMAAGTPWRQSGTSEGARAGQRTDYQ